MRPHARRNRDWTRTNRGLLLTVGLLGLVMRSFGANLAVTVLLPNGHPLGGAVITAQLAEGGIRPAAPVQAVMDQVDRAFAPDLLVIPVNSSVSFPNSDSVSHQIYSFSPAKRFQLPLYRGKPYPPTVFDHPGLVTLGCNIHDEMLAYIVVTNAPFFGRTAPSGAWSVAVPAGIYHVSIWHPRLREDARVLEAEVEVTESSGSALTLHLKKPLKPAPLEGRPHSWDGY